MRVVMTLYVIVRSLSMRVVMSFYVIVRLNNNSDENSYVKKHNFTIFFIALSLMCNVAQ